jgi:hypothetical protein
MAKLKRWTEAAKTKMQLGYLSDAPDMRLEDRACMINGERFGIWYGEQPEWVERDTLEATVDGHACKSHWDHEFRTVVVDGTYGHNAPSSSRKWIKVYEFSISERECPWCGSGCDDDAEKPCKLCDQDGDANGILYLGEYVGIVYRSKRPTWG